MSVDEASDYWLRYGQTAYHASWIAGSGSGLFALFFPFAFCFLLFAFAFAATVAGISCGPSPEASFDIAQMPQWALRSTSKAFDGWWQWKNFAAFSHNPALIVSRYPMCNELCFQTVKSQLDRGFGLWARLPKDSAEGASG
jgi:hypothetical protein